jgi:excisionase family DNA binding protein
MLTIAEVARRLNVSRSTVRRLKDNGELAHVVVGDRCVRFPETAVEAYLKRIACPSARSRIAREGSATPSSSRSADVVFFDGSRPARRKARRPSLKLVSASTSSTKP